MFRYVSTSYLMEIGVTHFSSNVLGLSFYIKVTQKIACCNTITDLKNQFQLCSITIGVKGSRSVVVIAIIGIFL